MARADSRKAKVPRPPHPSALVLARIVDRVDAFIADPATAEAVVSAAPGTLPADVLANVSTVEALPRTQSFTARDLILIQLGFGFDAGAGFDHTMRAEGARTVGGKLGAAFKARHVPGVVDAVQNIGKNTINLLRGNVAAYDALLLALNTMSAESRLALFDYIAARAALRARPVLPMPALRPAALSFAAVAGFLDVLLTTPSGGAFEQFSVAALLEALLDEYGLSGVGQLRVVTKKINASDASSGTAADVQIMRGNQIEQAFEVSANDWRSKVTQAVDAARNADLPRAHVIAAVEPGDRDLSALTDATVDVTLTEVRAFVHLMTAALRKPGREVALKRLYELVDRNQPDVELTNGYVRLLGDHQLTAD